MTARAKGATDGDAGAADEPTPEGGGPLPLDEIARRVGGRVSGDGAFRARDLRPVEEAGRDELALLSSRRYLPYVGESTAGAWLVTEELEGALADDDRPRVVVADAAPAVAALLAHFHPPVALPARIHPTAVLGPGVRLGPGVSVGAHTVLEAGVSIGEGTRLEAHVVLGREVSIGAGCHIHPHVVVYPRTSLGDRVVVHAGACLGADGFGYTTVDGGHVKIPQAGALTIGHDVEIGANTTIDRGSIGDTRIGDGVKIDNLVHLAHNVRVGAGTLIAGMVGVAGSTRIGRGVWLGGQAGAIGHLDIGDGARIAVASRVMRDVRSGETVSGDPARPHREDLRRQAHLGRIPRLLARIEALEARLDGEEGAHPGREGADTQTLERRVAELEARVQGPERPPDGGPTTP